MAGKKGRSGRKARGDGKKMRAVNLYIPMKESYGWNQEGKIDWIPETWFLQFKKIFGNRWQEEVRKMISNRTSEYERTHMWQCSCENRLFKWHRKTEPDCNRCGYEAYDYERYKSKQERRIHARNEPSQRALSLCPNCKNPLTLEMDLHGRKVMRCMKC